MSYPMQPIYRDATGRARFRPNGIIRRIVDLKMIDINDVACWAGHYPGITQDDVDQFWQLMGYSVCGYEELAASDLISDAAASMAVEAAESIPPVEPAPDSRGEWYVGWRAWIGSTVWSEPFASRDEAMIAARIVKHFGAAGITVGRHGIPEPVESAPDSREEV